MRAFDDQRINVTINYLWSRDIISGRGAYAPAMYLFSAHQEVHSLASFPGPKQVNKAIQLHVYTPA